MTPGECQLKADHCERMARAAPDDMDRRMLLETVKHWRNLARTARTLSRTPTGTAGEVAPYRNRRIVLAK